MELAQDRAEVQEKAAHKRVFVLGAGFSRDAGLPLLSDLLPSIRKLRLMDVPADTIPLFIDADAALTPFLERVSEGGIAPSLEDTFTLLDQTIAARDSCLGFSWRELVEARDALNRGILFVLHAAWAAVAEPAQHAYQALGARLLHARVVPGQEADPISVISLNWDYILEDSLYWSIRTAGLNGKADVDYCCYTTPLTSDTLHQPSITQKARGLFNFKIMKLHGSATFLRCPGCNRLFTGVGSTARVWDQYVLPNHCAYCPSESRSSEVAIRPLLEPFFITPTFVKVFDNAHIRTIWHNAHVDLSEAAEVVFIGYSLPEADYHVRTLLRRAIRRDTTVVVVLAPADEPADPSVLDGRSTYSRYRAFFGDRVRFDYRGARTFFTEMFGAFDRDASVNMLRLAASA